MNPDSALLTRLSELFEQAVELPPAQWQAFAEAQCGGDQDLRDRLLSLLERDRRLGSEADANPFEAGDALAGALPRAVVEGQRVGAFRIAERIGDGGMGSVYRAVRVDGQVEQEAALKLVRADRVNPYLLRRFSVERRVLAALDHPGICRFLDAGLLDGERPYVLMELVRGQTLFVHCDSRRLDLRARLALFREVLAAVAHAHRNLVVHRDIKSSNVLVTPEGQPKLVDFGIAKTFWDATAGETATQERFLTPSAAAPEQIEGKPVTVAVDVYALGALLYELLCGRAPFDFEGRSQGDIERLVREVPPPLMSRRAQDGADGAARTRGFAGKAALVTALQGDLDLIAATCLRKQSEERYASVEQIDAEIERFLQGRPIQARGNERWYRLRKFVSRNRMPVALGAGLALSLALGMGGVLVQTVAVREERNIALLERDRARSAVELLSQAFVSADPGRVAGAEVTAREILASARPVLESRFETQPALYASLASVIAEVEISLQLDTAAAETAARGLEAAERAGMAMAERRGLLIVQARALAETAQHELAESALRQVERIDQDEQADVKLLWGRLFAFRDQDEAALVHLRRAVELSGSLGPQSEVAVLSRWRLGYHQSLHGQGEAAVATFDECMAWMRAHGLDPEHPRVVQTRLWRLAALRNAKRLEEAESEAAAVIELISATYGERSGLAGSAHYEMSTVLRRRGEHDRALDHQRRAVDIRREVFGTGEASYGRAAFNLAINLGERTGHEAEAEALFREALAGAIQRVGPRSQLAQRYRAGLARHLLRSGRVGEALDLLLGAEPEPGTLDHWAPALRDLLVHPVCGTKPDAELAGRCEAGREALARVAP
jgi:eukaryotic-like serine/threonine-protein kinase